MFKQPLKMLGYGLVILCLTTNSFSTTTKRLWPKWEANNPLSEKTISHSEWQDFLNKNVYINDEGISLVNYPKIGAAEKKRLNQYITRLSNIDIDDYSREEQLAYWLNLYNALTIKVISEYYPVASVRDIKISPGLFSIGPWGATVIEVDHSHLSLDDIHNRIIRPIWNDPRTHYAVNNGTIGAANLSKTAYQGTKINQQLNQAAEIYINSLRGVQVIDGQLITSKIYEWFADDFGGDTESILDHIKLFSSKQQKEKLQHIDTIDGYMYNWHLNAPAIHP